MKCDVISAVLLLLTFTDLTFGRTLPKREFYEKEADILDPLKKGTTAILVAWSI
jgi:hypothetical protein